MQFRIKHLLIAAIFTALLTVTIQFVVQRQPQLNPPVVLVLSAPALLGFAITAFSSVMAFRCSKIDTDEGLSATSKYKNLAAMAILLWVPLLIYIAYCIAVGSGGE